MNPTNNVFDFPDVSLVCPKPETSSSPNYPSNSPPLGTIQQFDPPLNLVPQLARRWSCGDSQHAGDELLPASYYHNLGFALHNHIQMSNQRYLSEFNCPSTVSPIPSAHDSRQLAPLQPPYDHLGIQEQHLFSPHAYGNSMMPDESYFDNRSRSISAPTLGNSGHPSTVHPGGNSSACSNRRRFRTNFTEHQSMFLEDSFKESHYPDHKAKRHMADYLNIPEDRITVWFQNRRAKWRRKEHRQRDRSKNQETFTNTMTTFDYPCFNEPSQNLDVKLPAAYSMDQIPLNQFQMSPDADNSGQFLQNLDRQ